MQTGHADLLCAIIDQARRDVIAPESKMTPDEKTTAQMFFRDHSHIPVMPRGYVRLSEIAKAAGMDYRRAMRLCQSRNVSMIELGAIVLVSERDIVAKAKNRSEGRDA